MREYEIMLILPAEADEALVQTAIGRIEKIVGEHGGAVGTIDRWGRRRFAFEIDRQHDGYYVVVRFNAEPAAQAELERTLNLADEVIRQKVLVLPPAALAGPPKRSGRSTPAQAATPPSTQAATPPAAEAPAAPADGASPSAADPEPAGQVSEPSEDKDASPAPV